VGSWASKVGVIEESVVFIAVAGMHLRGPAGSRALTGRRGKSNESGDNDSKGKNLWCE